MEDNKKSSVPTAAKSRDIWDILQKVFPFVGLFAVILIFSIIDGQKIWTVNSIKNIFDSAIPYCIGGAGMLFVASQGSTDMSQGSLLAFSATIAGILSMQIGVWAFIPASIIVGALVGAFNGTLLAKFKVPSVMVTLAMLIVLRALVALFNNSTVINLPDSFIKGLNSTGAKVAILIVVVIVLGYLFEFTKTGFFSRCIGENQTVGQFSGIPVKTFKILAFVISGAMAGLCGCLSTASAGGVTPLLGNFFELEVMTAIFVGGIPVAGGASSKFYKVIIGSFMMAYLKYGLKLSGVDSATSELIQGVLLLAVVFFGLFVRAQFIRRQRLIAASETA
jgi:ribose transport system permease protein